jgi:uncharacterized protein (TIRG00374 family)
MVERPSATHGILVALAKMGLAGAILAFLVYRVQQNQGFARLVNEPKDWRLLAAALVCTFLSITLSFVRWHVLVNALGLKFRLTEALRLGSLGFALNFVSLGSVGGDLFKAIFLAKEFPGRRTEAVATVMVDRVVGLMMMLVLASTALVVADWHDAPTEVVVLCRTILLAAIVGFASVGILLFLPLITDERIRALVARVPLVGGIGAKLIGAMEAYRNQKARLCLAAGIGFVVDALFVTSFYLVAIGLPIHAPSYAQHMLIVPVANMAAAIPATPNGLGTLEAAADVLYRAVPGHAGILPGDGFLVALGHRITMMTVAVIGLVYYLSQRAELQEVLEEVEAAAVE